MTTPGQPADVLRYAAFSANGAGGNPAGVVLAAGHLDDAARLALAGTVGYSETAFLEPAGPGRYRLRYWSPRAEVAFCGHATIAGAVAVAERTGPGRVVFETAVGPVEVETRRTAGRLVATLTSVPTRTRPADPVVVVEALAALRWQSADLDPRYPPHVAYAGNDHLVLAVRDRRRLAALDYDYPVLAALLAREAWTTVHLVWAQSPLEFQARDPFPPGGVVEDPATGAAAAAFGGYLRALALVPAGATVTIHQGVDLGRPSLLSVDLDAPDGRVRVTGAAVRIAPCERPDSRSQTETGRSADGTYGSPMTQPLDVDSAPDPDSPEFLDEHNPVEKVSPDTTADAPATDATLISTDPGVSRPDGS